jgi:hypothetical protein
MEISSPLGSCLILIGVGMSLVPVEVYYNTYPTLLSSLEKVKKKIETGSLQYFYANQIP